MMRATFILGAVLVGAGLAAAQPWSPGGPPVAVDGLPLLTPAVETAPARPPLFWMSADYAFAWVRGPRLPALVTTSPDGTSTALAGVPGTPGVATLFGGDRLSSPMRPGLRLGAGAWFPDNALGWGIDAGFTVLSSGANGFLASSTGSPILARPFRDAATGNFASVLVAYPGSSAGGIAVRAESGNFYDGHLDIMERLLDTPGATVDVLIGYRAYAYSESLTVQQNLFPTGALFVPGTQIASIDNFGTRNIFNGADLGFRTILGRDALSLELLTKVAAGSLDSTVGISGAQRTTVPGAVPVSNPGGVLALGSNIGTYHNARFRFLPEAGATLRWQVASNVQLRLGYSFMLLNGVARAGNQIDTALTPANFPPAGAPAPGSQPTFRLQRSDVWIQTVNVGLAFTF
jgi:hypothetical protein